MSKTIYIASPYTVGNKLNNVKLQIDAFHVLRDLGYVPIAPLVTHFLNNVYKRPEEDWIDYGLELLRMCNGVVRIRPKNKKGKEIPSKGSDIEEIEAKKLGKDYHEFESIDEMKNFFIKQ